MARSSWSPSPWREPEDIPEPFQALRRQYDDTFEEGARDLRAPSILKLRLEISEGESDVTITTELPAIAQKDVEVSLSGCELTIKGEKRTEKNERKEGVKGRVHHRSERTRSVFLRTVTLPFEADPASVTAAFHDGVLTVTVLKPAEPRAATTNIEVKSEVR
jgi:HSP20 family protein